MNTKRMYAIGMFGVMLAAATGRADEQETPRQRNIGTRPTIMDVSRKKLEHDIEASVGAPDFPELIERYIATIPAGEAKLFYRQLIKNHPESAEVHAVVGRAECSMAGQAFEHGNPQGGMALVTSAMQNFDKALAIDPESRYALVCRGIAFLHMPGHAEQSRRDFDAVLALEKNTPDSPWVAEINKWTDMAQESDRLDHETANAPYLGVDVKEIPASSASPAVLQIARVEDKSPAAKAGLLPGDLITKIESQPVTTTLQWQETIAKCQIGSTIAFQYSRGGQSRKALVTLIPKPARPAPSANEDE